MSLIDLILNIAMVFLWMDWISARSAKPQSALSITSAVRPAGDKVSKGHGSIWALVAILLVRPSFYFSIGPAVDWTPTLNFLAVAIPWRSDSLGRMFLFSTLSFGKAIGIYYAWLLLLSAAAPRESAEEEGIHRLVRVQLGWLEKLPWWAKLLLPSVAAAVVWMGLARLFPELGLMPGTSSRGAAGQALAFGLAAVLVWKWLLVAVFLLHLLNIYVYLGTHPLWSFVSSIARQILAPLRFLHIGKADLAPLVGAALVIAVCHWLIEPLVVNTFKRFLL